MLIASDLLLLLTDDRTGRLRVASNQLDVALGGALLLQLAIDRHVTVDGDGRVVVADARATADPLLDEALSELAARQGKRAKSVVRTLGKGLRPRLFARLAEEGIVRKEHGKILGLIPTDRWPSSDTAHEDGVRAQVTTALRAGSTDDDHIAGLISLLHALRVVGKVVDPAALDVTKRELNEAAAQIAEGDWASEAVRKAIDAMLAAVIAATSSSSAASLG